MASTTTYGDFPGVQVTTAGGAITGVAVGTEQLLVLVGPGDIGDDGTAEASVNEAVQPDSRNDAGNKFGDGSILAEEYKDARANGAVPSFTYGVIVNEISISGESFSSATGTLTESPVVEDTDLITVTGGSSTDVTPELVYESPPVDPGNDDDTAYINPITGEVAFDSTETSFEVDYSHYDYETARDEAASVFGDEETGIIAQLTATESQASSLSGAVNDLRGRYKLAMGVQAAEPNAEQDDVVAPDYDTGNYTDNIDNDAMFLHAPARKEAGDASITGALSGYMAGADLGPGGAIFGDSLTVDDLQDRLTKAEADDLRGKEVMPIRQPPQGGSIEIADNLSTSQETDWVRDYWRRRIVDQAILIAKTVGDSVIGRINDDRTRNTVETTIKSELKGMADDRLITTNYFVEVYQLDADTVGIDLGITPQGIAKRIDVSITINT